MPIRAYPAPDLELSRDNQIVAHLLRQHITTLAVVEELYFPGLDYDTVRKVLRRLVNAKYLARYPLYANFDYFRLGKAAISRWGYPRTRAPSLGSQRLLYELGCLAFCCMGEAERLRLHASELVAIFPWFPESLTQWAYLYENSVLVSLRVECRAFGVNVLEKLGAQLHDYQLNPNFRSLVQAQRFQFAVVTATEQQEVALNRALQSDGFPVTVQTAHYAELTRFI